MTGLIKLSAPATREYWEIPILFEDADLLALDKPSQLLTSPDRYDPDRPNLMTLLHRDIDRGADWVKKRGLQYLANAHRLDFETSGVILLAKSKPVLVKLANLFGSERPVKHYLALVHGGPSEDSFEVRKKLAPHPRRLGIMRVDEKHGKKAATKFHLLERFARFCLLQCQPVTGRTHQIRVHLQAMRCPIVADRVYGGRPLLLSSLKPGYRQKREAPERPLIARVALHASGLDLIHPATGTTLQITAPWPKDLAVAVKYLRRFGQRRSGAAMSEQLDEAQTDD